MLDALRYFWRGDRDPVTPFPQPVVHLLVLLIFIALCIFCYRLARKPGLLARFTLICSSLLLLEQILTQVWYWTSGYLDYPLPLFHCRIAKILFIIFGLSATLRNAKRAESWQQYACCVGFYGALSGLLYPVPDPFFFPHISTLSFYVGHILLGLIALALLLSEHRPWKLRELPRVEGVVLFINMLILAYDSVTKINYSYMLEPPFFKSLPRQIGQFPYLLIVFVAYGLLAAISFIILQGIQRFFLRKNVPEAAL